MPVPSVYRNHGGFVNSVIVLESWVGLLGIHLKLLGPCLTLFNYSADWIGYCRCGGPPFVTRAAAVGLSLWHRSVISKKRQRGAQGLQKCIFHNHLFDRRSSTSLYFTRTHKMFRLGGRSRALASALAAPKVSIGVVGAPIEASSLL